MLLSVGNHLWELLTEGKKETLSIMLNPAWKSPEGGRSTDSWLWGAFRAAYHAPGNILPSFPKLWHVQGPHSRARGSLWSVCCSSVSWRLSVIKWPESQKGLNPISYSARQRTRPENISSATSPTLWRRLGLSQEPVWSQEHREESGV